MTNVYRAVCTSKSYSFCLHRTIIVEEYISYSGCIVVGYSGPMKSITAGVGAAILGLIIGVMDSICRVAICLFVFYVFRQDAQSYFWGRRSAADSRYHGNELLYKRI